MIDMPDGKPPEDFKFFVFHGRVHFIQVDFDRFGNHKRSLFNRELKKLTVRITYSDIEHQVSRPKDYEKMLQIAEKIGALFDFVRVDLYQTDQGILSGEVTFYPGAGIEPMSSSSWDAAFGKLWKIQTNSTTKQIECFERCL